MASGTSDPVFGLRWWFLFQFYWGTVTSSSTPYENSFLKPFAIYGSGSFHHKHAVTKIWDLVFHMTHAGHMENRANITSINIQLGLFHRRAIETSSESGSVLAHSELKSIPFPLWVSLCLQSCVQNTLHNFIIHSERLQPNQPKNRRTRYVLLC